ncbi:MULTISPECIES: hypothetical protein [Pseudomonas]|uniref:Uncharacterized protein n=2 Tax=Pseudomonas TaxID=286 RepID=A0A7X1GHQ4_9PSED|nr:MULTISPECIES: hypothetical protein [Pseudomonas]MBC2692700.1 hypothetical protein [Pseudomonas kielensis]MDD1009376.1 hypothetical protein [Pseudomonas shahriarae]
MIVSTTMDLQLLAEKMGSLTGLNMDGFAGLKKAQVMRDTALVEKYDGVELDAIPESEWREMLDHQDICF